MVIILQNKYKIMNSFIFDDKFLPDIAKVE